MLNSSPPHRGLAIAIPRLSRNPGIGLTVVSWDTVSAVRWRLNETVSSSQPSERCNRRRTKAPSKLQDLEPAHKMPDKTGWSLGGRYAPGSLTSLTVALSPTTTVTVVHGIRQAETKGI